MSMTEDHLLIIIYWFIILHMKQDSEYTVMQTANAIIRVSFSNYFLYTLFSVCYVAQIGCCDIAVNYIVTLTIVKTNNVYLVCFQV